MRIEVNASHPESAGNCGGGIMITPPIGEDYWLWRVPVGRDQAIVAFRKFGTIGCGFQKEKDWNTNLPLACPAVQIYEHIRHNKQCSATRAKCIAAIEMLREYASARVPDWADKVARLEARRG